VKIATYICVSDQDDSLYPQVQSLTYKKQRFNYWQCATVFFATSLRCNPKAEHVLYTNDTQTVRSKGVDLRLYLTDLGVKVETLPFKYFRPPKEYSNLFTNAFYKFDVMQALGDNSKDPVLLLDADCVWTAPGSKAENDIISGQVLLYDVHGEEDPDKKVDGMSRHDRAAVYKIVHPDYPTAAPIHIGGEIVGGQAQQFKILSEQLLKSYKHILKKFGDNPPRFADGRKIFDGNENLGSMVFNMNLVPWKNAQDSIKRIWTGYAFKNIEKKDLGIPIWHVPSEKLMGIPLLFNKALNKRSRFWKTPLSEFNKYIGGFLNIPKRRISVGFVWKLTKSSGIKLWQLLRKSRH
jgi:hypothetical protein